MISHTHDLPIRDIIHDTEPVLEKGQYAIRWSGNSGTSISILQSMDSGEVKRKGVYNVREGVLEKGVNRIERTNVADMKASDFWEAAEKNSDVKKILTSHTLVLPRIIGKITVAGLEFDFGQTRYTDHVPVKEEFILDDGSTIKTPVIEVLGHTVTTDKGVPQPFRFRQSNNVWRLEVESVASVRQAFGYIREQMTSWSHVVEMLYAVCREPDNDRCPTIGDVVLDNKTYSFGDVKTCDKAVFPTTKFTIKEEKSTFHFTQEDTDLCLYIGGKNPFYTDMDEGVSYTMGDMVTVLSYALDEIRNTPPPTNQHLPYTPLYEGMENHRPPHTQRH